MYWMGRRYTYKRWFGPARRWRATADSATLAHAIHKRRMRQRAMRIFNAMGLRVIPSVAPLAVDIVRDFNTGVNTTGQRAWPEVSGEPPVFGNAIGEIGHTGGGSWIWTGFTWERAILGG